MPVFAFVPREAPEVVVTDVFVNGNKKLRLEKGELVCEVVFCGGSVPNPLEAMS